MQTSDSIVIIPTYNEKENIENIIRAVFGLEKTFHILERKAIMDHIRSTDAVAKIEEILNEGCQEVKNSGPEKDRAA